MISHRTEDQTRIRRRSSLLDTEGEYRKLIESAKSRAQGVPLSQWELQAYNDARAWRPTQSRCFWLKP